MDGEVELLAARACLAARLPARVVQERMIERSALRLNVVLQPVAGSRSELVVLLAVLAA